MNKYDGWVLKSFMAGNPWLIRSYFHSRRTDVVEQFKIVRLEKGAWRKARDKGYFKIVKVKLVEVD